MRANHTIAGFPPHQWVIALSLMIALIVLVSMGQKASEALGLYHEKRALQTEIDMQKSEQARLESRKAYVQTDAYIEQIARRELKLARPGEVVVVPLPTPQDTSLPKPQGDFGAGLREWWGQITGGR